MTHTFSNCIIATCSQIQKVAQYMNTQEWDILNLVLSNTYTNQRTLAEDSGHSLGIVNRSIKTLIAEGYLDESIQPTQKAIEILYNFTKDTKKYIWKDSIKTYLEEQNEPTEELDMLCNMMQNIKDRYKAFKKSVRFDGQIIEISGKEYADMSWSMHLCYQNIM